MARLRTLKPRLQSVPARLKASTTKEIRMTGRKLQDRRLRVWTADPKCAACGRFTLFPHGFELDHKTSLFQGGADNHRNYSARQLDQQWGPSEGTGGVVTRDQSYTVIVDPNEAPRVSRFMEKAMRLPAVYLPHGHPKFEGIRGFGQAVDSRMRYPNPAIVQLSMTIRGFI